MSKLKEFAEFILEVENNDGFFEIQDSYGNWFPAHFASERNNLSYSMFKSNSLRIKPKEEEKKKIPLELCDITPNMIFKNRGWGDGHFSTLLSVTNEGVFFFKSFTTDKMAIIKYLHLLDFNWQYSTDNGKTWKGCYKYEN